jgi:DNA-binding transcriptional LysR family regulator
MELRQLRYFVAVAEELHFHRAAERLHMSQPPLSQQIRKLEEDVGVQLLDRNRRGVRLTPAGETFLGEARAILESVDHAALISRRVARGEVGRLSVGFVGSAMFGPLPDVLREFRERYPDVELELRELPSAPQVAALAAGRIDVGFLRPPIDAADLEAQRFLRERILVALPSGHALAEKPRLHVEELRDESFILLARREAPGLHDAMVHGMSRVGGRPEVVQEVSEMQTVVGLVAAGMGISLVPASARALALQRVVYLEVDGIPPVELDMVWRRGERSPVLATFRALVAEQSTNGDGSVEPTPPR